MARVDRCVQPASILLQLCQVAVVPVREILVGVARDLVRVERVLTTIERILVRAERAPDTS